MSRFTKVAAAFGAGSVLLLSIGQSANAQTPAQMEYERQQREYWRQQEQQRQEQQRLQQLQNDNARRQQEESSRFMRGTAPGPHDPSTSSPTPGVGGRPTAQSTATSERRYALPGHGYFVIQVPGNWKDQVQQARNGAPPTVVLNPASGNSFQVLLTPSWPETKDRAPHSRDELRAAVERGAQSAKSWAVESKLALHEMQGSSGPGFYFSAAERSPKPGAHKFVTTGIIRIGELSVPFTITTAEAQSLIVSQALDLLKTGVQQGAGAAAAAPRTTPSGGAPAVDPPATQSAGTLKLNSYYTCNGERVAVLRCRSEADDAFCSVQYPDRKSAATGGLTPELAERRGELVKKLQQCQGGKS